MAPNTVQASAANKPAHPRRAWGALATGAALGAVRAEAGRDGREEEDGDEEEEEDEEDEEAAAPSPEELAGMDFEELEDVCDDHSLDVDPDDYEEEDIEKFRKAIAKELGITLPKAKKETKAKGKKGKK